MIFDNITINYGFNGVGYSLSASLHRKMIFGGLLPNTTREQANAQFANQKQTTTNKLWQNLTKQ